MDNSDNSKSCGTGCQGIMWWTTLLVAVLAIPSLGIIVASISHLQGFGGVLVFVLACWLCTYLGMRLMKNPKFAEKLNELNKE